MRIHSIHFGSYPMAFSVETRRSEDVDVPKFLRKKSFYGQQVLIVPAPLWDFLESGML